MASPEDSDRKTLKVDARAGDEDTNYPQMRNILCMRTMTKGSILDRQEDDQSPRPPYSASPYRHFTTLLDHRAAQTQLGRLATGFLFL